MKTYLAFAFVILAIVLIFIGYENYKVRSEVTLAFDFWANATTKARNENLTTQDFYSRYDNLGDPDSDGIFPDPVLVQRVQLSGLLCTEYAIRVYYSSQGDDTSNLTMISREVHGMFCFI